MAEVSRNGININIMVENVIVCSNDGSLRRNVSMVNDNQAALSIAFLGVVWNWSMVEH
jgi:hypothetical protein